MKIHADLRAAYEDQRLLNERLKERLEKTISRLKDKSWHFESRLKSEEGFAVKVEAGLVPDPTSLEDFLAGVLVVRNVGEVRDAEQRLAAEFDVVARRPKSPLLTLKTSSNFPFDDLRLYLQFKRDDSLPAEASDGVTFEVQVRTFLQHAWTVSTHDVVYKTDSVSWGRERIAHQVKAMLEHAEVAVESMTTLESAPSMPLAFARYEEINAVIGILRQNWDEDALPTDLKRLATAILEVAEAIAGLQSAGIAVLLDTGRERYGGTHNLDWSPYRAASQYLAEQYPLEFKQYVRGRRPRRPVYVYGDTLDYLGVKKPTSGIVARVAP